MKTESKELRLEDVLFAVSEAEVATYDGDGEDTLIIGQDRALRALSLGTEIRAKGYNIFVTGLPGTGKRTTVMQVLKNRKSDVSLLRDIAYVYNFQRPDSPAVLYFEPGQGRLFKKALHQLVENLKGLIKGRLTSDSFKDQRDRIVTERENEENRLVAEFEGRLASEGFKIVEIDEDEGQASDIVPLYKGEPMDFEQLHGLVDSGELTEAYWNETRERYYRFMDEMKQLFQDLRKKRSKMEEELESLRAQVVEMDVQIEIDHLQSEFTDPAVRAYLAALKTDIIRNVYLFSEDSSVKDYTGGPAFVRYGVNVIVDHSESVSVPIVYESHPDYAALFGSQEMLTDMAGETRTNFMMIRPGALIRASGGFLIILAEDILNEEDAWNSLKRALQDGKTEIRNPPNPFFNQPQALKPEPVDIDVKVLIMGNEQVYDALYNTDDDFPKLFKIPAEFDSVMDRDATGTREYISFIRRLSREEGLLDCDYSGLSAVLEYGVRVAEFRNKLTTRFSLIADLVREANHWGRIMERKRISRDVINRTLEERRFLHNLPEEKIDEQILSGEILISLKGTAVGRINGLAILDRGYYAFGRPLVISARTSPGHDGIINIERESGLSGEIHDKGVLIIEGYLQTLYARNFPLSLRASICFEQSYIEVDGDSAASAEIYTLLSAIAEIPLRQDLAVTGSVNQMGDIQPVGGVSEKIEGFYEVCKKTGLTGTQGVIIPRLNIPNLILSTEVQEAVKEGRFHLYTVTTVNEGIEILTGLPAGERTAKGGFKPGSVNYRVEKRLHEMALQVKDFGGN